MTSPDIPSPKGESEQSPFEAFWDFICPGIRCTPQDRAHFEPAVNKAVDAARRSSSSREEVRREALEPFAKIADWYHDSEDDSHEIWVDAHERATRVTVGMCKAARRALSQGE